MAINYTGDETATQAPSPAPGRGVRPIFSLPEDTDGWTVGNFYQALKTAADYIAFLQRMSYLPLFGDGSDGALAQGAGSLVLTANKNYTTVDLTSTANVSPGSHIIRAQQYIKLRGTSTLGDAGNAGANDARTPPGSGGGVTNHTLGIGAIGGAGGIGTGNGAPGVANTANQCSLGGAGAAGGVGAAGGGTGGAGGGVSLNAQLDVYNLLALMSGYADGYNGSAFGRYQIVGGGGGGGGGGYGGSADGLPGGGGGGVVILCAPVIDVGAGCTITAAGGKGGAQTVGISGATGAGGGGGGGGVLILICDQLIETGTVTAAGGLGGDTFGGGTSGGAGAAGTVIRRVLPA